MTAVLPSPAHEVIRYLPDWMDHARGEASMMPTLMRWLLATGRVRSRTSVAFELPWVGRRVDLALLNGRGMTTAFELKIGRLQRVIEQAAYNGSAFHKSWVVTANTPKSDGLAWAHDLGLGLIVVKNERVIVLGYPRHKAPDVDASRRLRQLIASRAHPVQ